MAEIIQLRRDTSGNFTTANPILAQGEPALEINTLKEKIGDGITAWNDLIYRYQTIDTNDNIAIYDAWSVGGLDVRGYATNYPILGTIYNAVPKTVTLATAPTTTDFKRIDIIAADTLGDIVIILGNEGLVGIEPFVDPNLYFRIRPLLLTAGATTPVDPDTGTGTLASLVLFKEFGTVVGGESDVTGSDASIAISTVTPITGTKSIEATTVSNLDYAQFLFGTTQTTTNKTHFNFNLKLKSTVQTNKYWFFRVYNGASIIGSFLFKHGQYGFNANDLGVQSISIPLTSTPFVDINYTKVTLFFYHNSGTITGYWIDDVEFLNALPSIIYDNYTIGSSGTEKVSLYKNGVLGTEVDLKTVLNTVALTPITTANKLVTEGDITGKENIANKQNSLATDGTGAKYPTVDAVNAGLATKLDASAYNQHFKGVYLTLAALNIAHPTASAGDYAQVNETGATDVLNYNWDAEESVWIPNAVGGSGATNTDELPEGTTNLYHTGARVLATILSGLSIITGGDVVATDTVIQAFGKLQKNINDLWIAVNLNTAKVSNATHTGEVTGATALTVDKTAISNKTEVTALGEDFVLIGDTSDTANLKKALISGFATKNFPDLTNKYDDYAWAMSDVTTDLVSGDTSPVYATFPFTLNGFFVSVGTAPTGASIVINLKKNGVTVLSTQAQIEVNEFTSLTGIAPVVSVSSFVKGDKITPEIVQVGSTIAGKDLKIYLDITRV